MRLGMQTLATTVTQQAKVKQFSFFYTVGSSLEYTGLFPCDGLRAQWARLATHLDT